MYIIFDGRHIINKYSGLGRFTFSLLLELINSNNYSKLDIIIQDKLKIEDNEILFYIKNLKNDKIKFIKIDAPLFNFIKGNNIAKYVNSKNPDLYFYPHFDIPFGIKAKSIFVVHDVFSKKTFFHEKDNSFIDDFIYSLKKKRYIKNVIFNNNVKFNLSKKNLSCIAVSNSTKKDMLEFIDPIYQDKIKVVYEASFENNILIDSSQNFLDENLFKNKYLLYVGDRRPHKNLKHMIDIFNEISKKDKSLKFYIVGSQKLINFDYKKYVRQLNNKNIIEISNVSDTDLQNLYKFCTAFFFLSKHEGFGLPILEAAKYDKKIITSNKSSLIEIAPKNSLLLDPYIDIEIATKKILSYINKNIIIDNKDYLKNFSWKKAMKEIFYNESSN